MRPLGIFAWFGYELPLEESLRRIKAAGFDQVLLWWGEFEGDIPLLDQPDTVRRLGLAVENAHAPFDGCNELWLPGERGERYVHLLNDCIDGCAATGIPVLVVHLTDEANPPPYSVYGLDRVRRVIAYAEDKGVELAFENLRHVPHLQAVMETCKSPMVRFCYDSGHHNGWCREEPFLQKYGSRLSALHLHDNDRVWDYHRLPFDGNTDWATVTRQIAETGYQGGVSLEVQAFQGYEQRMDAEAFLQRAYTAAVRVRGLLDSQKLREPKETPL